MVKSFFIFCSLSIFSTLLLYIVLSLNFSYSEVFSTNFMINHFLFFNVITFGVIVLISYCIRYYILEYMEIDLSMFFFYLTLFVICFINFICSLSLSDFYPYTYEHLFVIFLIAAFISEISFNLRYGKRINPTDSKFYIVHVKKDRHKTFLMNLAVLFTHSNYYSDSDIAKNSFLYPIHSKIIFEVLLGIISYGVVVIFMNVYLKYFF